MADITLKNVTVTLKREELECSICADIPLDMWCKQSCMHSVCRDCMQRLVNAPCPTCRNQSPWMPNVQINRIIGAMRVECEYGCGAETDYSDYTKHRGECMQRPSLCPHTDCDWAGTWAARLTHVDECVYARLECPHCKFDGLHRGAYDHHVAMCNYRRVACDQCHVQMEDWKRMMHQCVPRDLPDRECKEAVDVKCNGCNRSREQTSALRRGAHIKCNTCHRWHPAAGGELNALNPRDIPDVIRRANLELEWQGVMSQIESEFLTDEQKDEQHTLMRMLLEEARAHVQAQHIEQVADASDDDEGVVGPMAQHIEQVADASDDDEGVVGPMAHIHRDPALDAQRPQLAAPVLRHVPGEHIAGHARREPVNNAFNAAERALVRLQAPVIPDDPRIAEDVNAFERHMAEIEAAAVNDE